MTICDPLIDKMLPRADVRLRHRALFRVPAERAFRAARDLDVLHHPLARVLVSARALPLGGTGPPILRISDLPGPAFGWSVLGEQTGTELVLGTVALAGQVFPGWAAMALGPVLLLSLGAALIVGATRRPAAQQ